MRRTGVVIQEGINDYVMDVCSKHNRSSSSKSSSDNEDMVNILNRSIDHADIGLNRRKSISKVVRLKKNFDGVISPPMD